MSEVVERVARALAPLAWAALGTGDTLQQKNRRTASIRHARAAIEAMREPSKAMVGTGAANISPWWSPAMRGRESYGDARKAAKSAFMGMIDEALKGIE
jgi:hypothetical protein